MVAHSQKNVFAVLIIGGQDALDGQFPSGLKSQIKKTKGQVISGSVQAGRSLNQVTLKRSLGDHYCGRPTYKLYQVDIINYGIINYNKVITAAHCKQQHNNWSADVGAVNLNAQRQQIAGSFKVKINIQLLK